MKSGVEHGDLRDTCADDVFHGRHRFQFETVVHWSEFDLTGDGGLYFRGYDGTLAIVRSAVHDAVPGDINPLMFLEQRSERRFEHFFSGALLMPIQVLAPYGRQGILRQVAVRQFREPAFETARSSVENQNFHDSGQCQSRISGISSP